MGKLVLFYSFSGHSAKLARDYAKANGAEIIEVKTSEKLGKFRAYTSGCFKAMKGQSMPIEPLKLSDYSEVDVFAPVWAGHIAPPMNAALRQLSKGTKVALHLVSASGGSNKEKNTANVAALGFEIVGYEDLK